VPSLTTPDGEPVTVPEPASNVTVLDPAEVDRQFSRVMADDDPGGVQAPPRRPDTPAGEQAPKRGRGRPRKDPAEKPRVAEKPAEPPKPAANVDYVEAAAGVSTLAWATLAAIPMTTAYAAVIEANQEQLVGALANGAKHNPKIAQALEKAATGGGGVYALQLAAVGVNMGMQTLQLLKDPQLRAEASAHTQQKFREFLKAQGVNVPGETAPEAADVPAAA
jgi:hypothetical protein